MRIKNNLNYEYGQNIQHYKENSTCSSNFVSMPKHGAILPESIKSKVAFQSTQQISFKSKREDRNVLMVLTEEGSSLNEPQQKIIRDSIKRVSNEGTPESINFLFDILSNLNYGIRKDSELGKFIEKESFIASSKQKQNNNWEELLKEAIIDGIEQNNFKDDALIKEKYEKLIKGNQSELFPNFSTNVTNSVIENSKDILKLRNDILNSETLINTKNIDKNATKVLQEQKNNIKRNIDYFIASSEIANGEKVACLKVIKHIASPEYNINPVLKDYKLKILDEVLGDLVGKIPEQDKLLTKFVNQRKHGMCAAISIVRKAFPAEYKLGYVTTIAAELDDSNEIEVHNPHSLNLADKIKVKKANLDYKEAIKQNYRITDAAVTNWMNIADSFGSESEKPEYFSPFDSNHYGMFHDAHLLNDLQGENKPKHYTLRALIKLQSVSNSIEKAQQQMKEASSKINKINNEYIETHRTVLADTIEVLKTLVPLSDDKIREKAIKILNLNNEKENKIFGDMYSLDTAQIVKKVLTEETGCQNQEKISTAAKTIAENLSMLARTTALKNSNAAKTNILANPDYLTNLFKFAAYNRVKQEFELDIPEHLEQTANNFGVDKNLNNDELKVIVLRKMENAGIIASRKELDILNDKINELEIIKRKSREGDIQATKDSKKVRIDFIQYAKKHLKKVHENFAKDRNKIIREYKKYNKELAPELEELYAKCKEKGTFWASEEGQSGLWNSQQMQIIQQITGKEHFCTGNISNAIDHIESGKSGGILSSSVSDTDFAFHAQYIRNAKKMISKNHESDKIESQRTIFTDNTWGPMELANKWFDSEGNMRTNYGRNNGGEFGQLGGFGYKYGFIVEPDYTIGVTEADVLSKFVQSRSPKGQEIKVALSHGVILQGEGPRASKNNLDFTKSIMNCYSKLNLKVLNALQSQILQGNSKHIENLGNELAEQLPFKLIELCKTNKSKDLKSEVAKIIETYAVKYPAEIFVDNENLKSKNLHVNYNNFINSLTEKICLIADEYKKKNTSELFKNLDLISETEKTINEELKQRTSPIIKIDKELGGNLDKIISDKRDKILKAIDDSSFTTFEKFEALPKNNNIKLTMQKAAYLEMLNQITAGEYVDINEYLQKKEEFINKSTNYREIRKTLAEAKTSADLDRIPELFKKSVIAKLIQVCDKNSYTNKKLPTTIEELKKIQGGNELINFIDAKYNPTDNQEAITIFNKLLDMSLLEKMTLLNSSTNEALGIKIPNSYNFVQRIRGLNEGAEKVLNELVFYENASSFFKNVDIFSDADIEIGHQTADALYRRLSSDLSIFDVIGYINSSKTNIFEQYKVRPVIPGFNIISPKQLESRNKAYFDELKAELNKINELKKSELYNNSELTEKISGQIEIFKHKSLVVANSTVTNSQADKLIGLFNFYAKAIANNADSEELKKIENNVVKFMSEYNYLKHPKALLDSFIEDLSDSSKYNCDISIRNNIIQLKGGMLAECFDASSKLITEFQLLNYIKNGEIHQIARTLKDVKYGMGQKGSEKPLTWDSEKLLSLIIETYQDPANNNSTLKMLLQSLGLSDASVDVFMKGPAPEKHNVRINMLKSKLDTFISDQNNIDKFHKTFFDKTISKNKADSKYVSDITEASNEYIDNLKKANVVSESSEALDKYIGVFRDNLLVIKHNGVKENAKEFIKRLHNDIIGKQEDYIEEFINLIETHQTLLNRNIEHLKMVQTIVDKNSQQSERISQYLQNAEKVIKEMQTTKDIYQNPILDRIQAEAKTKTDMVKQESSQSHVQELLRAVVTKNELLMQNKMQYILANKDPKIIEILKKSLNGFGKTDYLKTVFAGLLAHLGEYDSLNEYLKKLLSQGDDSKLDEASLLAYDGLVSGIAKTSDEVKRQEYLKTLEDLFKISTRPTCRNPYSDQLMQMFINSLHDKSTDIDKMLVNIIFNKNEIQNARMVSLLTLAQSKGFSALTIFEECIKKLDEISNNDLEKLNILGVATSGIKNIREKYPNIPTLINQYLSKINIQEIADRINDPEFPLEVKSKIVNAIIERIKNF